jgi:hypothetical protein
MRTVAKSTFASCSQPPLDARHERHIIIRIGAKQTGVGAGVGALLRSANNFSPIQLTRDLKLEVDRRPPPVAASTQPTQHDNFRALTGRRASMKCILFAVVALVLAQTNARADFMDGNLLLSDCEDTISDNQVLCPGYIMGIHDFIMSFQSAGLFKATCFPENATAHQFQLVIEKYLRDHPADLSRAASEQVYIALIQAFACQPAE